MEDRMKSALAFEESIMSIIKIHCLKNKKEIYTESKNNHYKYFDGYAPNGVFDDIPTVIEIKYTKNPQFFKASLNNILKTYIINNFNIDVYNNNSSGKKVKFLYISLLNENDIKKIEIKEYGIKYENLIIEILPISKIINLLEEYPIEASRLNDLISVEKNTKNIVKQITDNVSSLEAKTTENDIIKK